MALSVKCTSRPFLATASITSFLNSAVPVMVSVLPNRSRASWRATDTPDSVIPVRRMEIVLPVSTNRVLSVCLSR
ncbi:hypothetical protein ALO49_200231 [Pseudomonas savastanoi pv. retacarpa]|nr:hypothetical protein ALO49_200231 [Pseudomonas savastanoi pv. retacarpa]